MVPADPAAACRALPRGRGRSPTGAFINPITAFHLTNPIARASKVMAECARLYAEPQAMAAE
ncbi:MAG: hypothetical protein AcusKO_33550 [Acuticoccus sp.]